MRHHSSGFTLFGTLVLLIAGGCSEPTSNQPLEEPSFGKVIEPNCQLGCNEDPPPGEEDADGIFLGSGVTDIACFTGSISDGDQDGISDFCEKNLAPAFAPQLAMTKGSDNLGREPKVAVKRLGTAYKARIMYLLSYYVDRGPNTAWCNNNFPTILIGIITFAKWRIACEGHDGDSEWIVLDVYYNPTTHRWLLDQAIYSAHTGMNKYTRGAAAYPLGMIYPGGLGGYPRAYVAYQKHANYATDSQCDSGALLGTDTCNANLFERVVAGFNVNIASRAVHRYDQDCWRSSNPIYSSNNIEECYWKFDKFLGWHVGYSPGDSEYSPKLSAMGF